jgi:tetratricopeptide (TPR) repeat protein
VYPGDVRRIALIVLVLLARDAAAQSDKAAEATRLFDQALALRKDDKIAEACALFQKSFELDRAPGTALNVGDCAERDGKLAQAWVLFDEAAREFDRTGKAAGAKLARDRADALAPKLAVVAVRVADPRLPGLVVKIGDQIPTLAAEITLHLEPGPVEVSASAPGHQPFATTAQAAAGKRIDVAIPALGVEAGPGGPGQHAGEGHAGRRSPGRVKLALVVGGAGAAVWVGSIAIGLAAKSQYNSALDSGACTDQGDFVSCTDPAEADKIRSAGTKADIGTGLAVAGSALLVGAAVLYFTAPRETVMVAPMATATSVGVGISGRF